MVGHPPKTTHRAMQHWTPHKRHQMQKPIHNTACQLFQSLDSLPKAKITKTVTRHLFYLVFQGATNPKTITKPGFPGFPGFPGLGQPTKGQKCKNHYKTWFSWFSWFSRAWTTYQGPEVQKPLQNMVFLVFLVFLGWSNLPPNFMFPCPW